MCLPCPSASLQTRDKALCFVSPAWQDPGCHSRAPGCKYKVKQTQQAALSALHAMTCWNLEPVLGSVNSRAVCMLVSWGLFCYLCPLVAFTGSWSILLCSCISLCQQLHTHICEYVWVLQSIQAHG